MVKRNITTEQITKMVYNAVKSIREEMSLNEARSHNEYYDKKRKKFMARSTKHKSADAIIDWLKKDTTDCAAIAAQLWPNKNEDSRRSYFYKCRDHASYTANGKTRHYDFTKKQYLHLFGIMTNSVS